MYIFQNTSRLLILENRRFNETSLQLAQSSNQGSSEDDLNVDVPEDSSISNSNLKSKNKKNRFNRTNRNKRGNNFSQRNNSSKSTSERSSATSFNMTNHSTGNVATIFVNRGVIQQPYRNVVQQTIELDFTVSPIHSRLSKHADVWASRIISIQQLQLRDTLGPKQDTWYPKLFSAFIYSYFKSLLYGVYHTIAEPLENSTCVVKGHNILYSVIKQSKFVFRYKDINVFYNFKISNEDIEQINQSIIDGKYDFVSKFLFKTDFKFSLFNPECERHLKDLNQMLGNNGPLFSLIDDESSVSNYLTQDNFPICNSFYTKESNETKWYYTSYSDVAVLSQAVLCGKSLFIKGISEESEILKYYTLNNEDDFSSLVKYEVTSVAGFNYPDYTDGNLK